MKLLYGLLLFLTHSCLISTQSVQPQKLFSTALREANLTVLSSVVVEAGQDALLSTPDFAMTLFAPTDEALTRMLTMLNGTLSGDGSPERNSVLQYHVVLGTAYNSSQIPRTPTELQTALAGSNVTVVKDANNVIRVNNARVVRADIPYNAMIIHAIDQVLIPPSLIESVGSANRTTSGINNGTDRSRMPGASSSNSTGPQRNMAPTGRGNNFFGWAAVCGFGLALLL